MKRLIVVVIFLGAIPVLSSFVIPFLKGGLSVEQVDVRVLGQVKIQSMVLSPYKGNYYLWMDGQSVAQIDQTSTIKLNLVNDSVEVKAFEINYGKCRQLKVFSIDDEKILKAKVVFPDRKARYYDDNITVTCDGDRLKVINNTIMDNYIAGVSQAEAGTHSTLEFYKVQSILARTYALAHLYKHAAEGYNLCDQVHCQAFYGKSSNEDILEAVATTREMVVVDDNLQLITAVFHSNSGGQTMNSEDVWGTRTSYLKSVNDTFSLRMPNSRWERKMLTEDWLTYLKLKHNYPVDDSMAKVEALNFKQPARKVNLEYADVKVPLKTVRNDLQLKSTFFSIEPVGDTVIFKGRGFGHGIGMCQEGAMRMSKLGYDYKTILNFYYQNIHVISLKELNFFKE